MSRCSAPMPQSITRLVLIPFVTIQGNASHICAINIKGVVNIIIENPQNHLYCPISLNEEPI
jgi:hypothetical protein